MHPVIIVAAPRLQQQHARPAVGGQPVGQHATRRSGTNDDEVKVSVEDHCAAPAISRQTGSIARVMRVQVS